LIKEVTRKKSLWIVATVVIAIVLVVFALNLRGRGLRQQLVWRVKAVRDAHNVAAHSDGQYTNVVFLHHSTGRNLIEQGAVREHLNAAGLDFWDHDYNPRGLTRPDGTPTEYSYGIPDDNTDPDGLARIFSQTLYPWPLNAFSGLMQHEVIVFKSCFPVSHIVSDQQLERYKAHYLHMRHTMDQHLDRLFIVVTPPPLNPAATDAEAAARARAFADWLASDAFLTGHSNVFTFDLFDQLADPDPASSSHNMLRAEYREGTDSHPNRMANETIGPLFAEFVIQAIEHYRSQGAGQP
jgi:hypothetical protein